MRPHSADLRHRIVTLYEQGEGAIRQLAKRFQVSRAFGVSSNSIAPPAALPQNLTPEALKRPSKRPITRCYAS